MKHFMKETDLCQAFIDDATKDGIWTAYPESAGFDILLVRSGCGTQVGVEAKLVMNAKVLTQALPSHEAASIGPDFRAILVPQEKVKGDLCFIAERLGITFITAGPDGVRPRFWPFLPGGLKGCRYDKSWHCWFPMQRCPVPEFMPDVPAGAPSPRQLSPWKVKAIKLCIMIEDRPVTRADFKELDLSPALWLAPHGGWLKRTEAGYVPGPNMPDFKTQHPVAYEEIKAKRKAWEVQYQADLLPFDLRCCHNGD